MLEASFQRCDILKINDEELVTISRLYDIPGLSLEEKCWHIFDQYGLKMLILTCGTNGSYVFHAGGKSVAVAHETAVKVSAYVCTQKGAMPVVPEELKSI